MRPLNGITRRAWGKSWENIDERVRKVLIMSGTGLTGGDADGRADSLFIRELPECLSGVSKLRRDVNNDGNAGELASLPVQVMVMRATPEKHFVREGVRISRAERPLEAVEWGRSGVVVLTRNIPRACKLDVRRSTRGRVEVGDERLRRLRDIDVVVVCGYLMYFYFVLF